MANKNGLTDRQRMFVQEYLVDFRATQAAIRSGYSPRTAEQQGAKLLRNAQVQEAVKAAMADLVIRTLADIAFADLGAEASETKGGKSAPRRVKKRDKRRALELLGRIKDETLLPPEVRAALAEASKVTGERTASRPVNRHLGTPEQGGRHGR